MSKEIGHENEEFLASVEARRATTQESLYQCEIQSLKAKLKVAVEGLENLVVQFKKDADDSFDDPATCAFLDCAAEAAAILQKIKAD